MASQAWVERIAPHQATLNAATQHMRQLRDSVLPIYQYYFPPSWFGVIARLLRFRPRADFARYAPELSQLRATAWQLMEDSKAACHAILAEPAHPLLKRTFQLLYQQLNYDGNFICCLHYWVEGMRTKDPAAMDGLAVMYDFSRKADRNRALLLDARAHLDALSDQDLLL